VKKTKKITMTNAEPDYSSICFGHLCLYNAVSYTRNQLRNSLISVFEKALVTHVFKKFPEVLREWTRFGLYPEPDESTSQPYTLFYNLCLTFFPQGKSTRFTLTELQVKPSFVFQFLVVVSNKH
jgi:hypothetical protein